MTQIEEEIKKNRQLILDKLHNDSNILDHWIRTLDSASFEYLIDVMLEHYNRIHATVLELEEMIKALETKGENNE